MYTSPCTAHYYRERLDHHATVELAEQRRLVEESLAGIEEERAELAEMVGREAARLRGDLEHEASFLRAKLAAINELLEERANGERSAESL